MRRLLSDIASLPRDARDVLVFAWAWYMFPVLEALGLRPRTEKSAGRQPFDPSEPDSKSPLQAQTPSQSDAA